MVTPEPQTLEVAPSFAGRFSASDAPVSNPALHLDGIRTTHKFKDFGVFTERVFRHFPFMETKEAADRLFVPSVVERDDVLHAPKLLPHPQVRLAFGLWNSKPLPFSPSE